MDTIYNVVVTTRNGIIHTGYKNILKKIFFAQDPERVHDRMVHTGRLLGTNFITRTITSTFFSFSNKMLEQKILGIQFSNPIGLSAGFDKNAELTQIMPSVGFGFEEIGSITGEFCKGNDKPRLWRLKNSQALGVYYGLKNDGAEAISTRLSRLSFKFPIGISIAKTNNKETCDTETGIKDYVKAYRAFKDIGDYITINISCPNTFGGLPFTDEEKLDSLLKQISKERKTKPIFLKLPPDLTLNEIDKLIDISLKYKVDGFVCSNLTKKRDNMKIDKRDVLPEKGGISGKVVEDLSNDLIKHVYKKTEGKSIIIGVGGVFSAEDAYEKIKLGASLIQLITGMIFEGPQLISDINQGLVRLLKKDGYSNIKEAIGKNVS